MLHNVFNQFLLEECGLHYDIQQGNHQRPTATRTTSKLLGEVLMKLGIPISPKSSCISFSHTLLHLSNDLLAEFISGLYDADGSVYVRGSYRKGSSCIEFVTCSEMLARQLQLVFLRYSIHARLRLRKPQSNLKISGKLHKWILEIRGYEQFLLFRKHFFLRHPVKKVKLEELLSRTVCFQTNIDLIPGVAPLLKLELQHKNLPLKKIGWHNSFSRTGLQKLLEKISCDTPFLINLRKIAHSDIFWDKVKTIIKKKSTYNYVYDLTVADSHNFVVDGVLVHNTASVVKDEFLKGWSLEAGALVLANNGLACIDEFDKMSTEDRSALHEALEQQQVTISKANIQATLRARTTLLAAANPKLGRFDPYTPIPQQIDLPPTLINRFDLIFPVRDLPDKVTDEKIASHVLELSHTEELYVQGLPLDVLRKYLAYIKKYVHPQLTKGAINEIKHFYVTMRNSNENKDGMQAIPVSARQLEALIRLSEAFAKVRLDDKVKREDALHAIDLLHHCLQEIGLDPETGKIDIDRISTGITTSVRNKILVVKDIIRQFEEKGMIPVPIEEVVAEASLKGITDSTVDEILEKLKRSGDLFEPRKGFIQRI